MQRVDLSNLVMRLLEPPSITVAPAVTSSSTTELPNWQVGQQLAGQILENLEGQVLVLIDGRQLRADWPGAPQEPGTQVELQVVGRAAGQWRLALLASPEMAAIGTADALLTMLERLDWPLTYNNVKRLARLLAGQSLPAGSEDTGETSANELCPPNFASWQQLFGHQPVSLAAAFFTWQPFTIGLFVEDEAARQETDAAGLEPISFLFVAELPRLGQVEVLGRGRWPDQSIVFIARKETTLLLQKRVKEITALLAKTGINLRELTLRAAETPLLQLLQPQLIPYRGLNRRL